MAITREVVLHVGRLAELDLDDAEVDHLVRHLGGILGYFEELSAVDTTSVPDEAYVAVAAAPLRPDELVPGTDRAAALAEAARSGDGAFAVPAFVDEG